MGIKKSSFTGKTTLEPNDSFDFVRSSTNFKISFSDFSTALGVTGTLGNIGTGTPVLSGASPNYELRSIKGGSGIHEQIGPNGDIELKHNFTFDTEAVPLVESPNASSPVFPSFEGVGGISVSRLGNKLQISGDAEAFSKLIIVQQPSDFGAFNVLTGRYNQLRSDVVYFIDGVVDMGAASIEVPESGLFIQGHNFSVSRLISTQDNYTMFQTPGSGSCGSIDVGFIQISVSGTNSRVYSLVNGDPVGTFTTGNMQYNNCTSLGYLDGFLQGQEVQVAKVLGSPTLELRGNWGSGFQIDGQIIRFLNAGMTEPIWKAGNGFSIQSRFYANPNIDLTGGPVIDFSPSNFPNSSSVQIEDAQITRNGIKNASDSNLSPNLAATDLAADFKANRGFPNTFVEGRATITTEALTPIAATGVFVDVAGTWSTSQLSHFDSPSNGRLRHLGSEPQEYRVFCDLVVSGGADNVLDLKIVKYDSSADSFVDVGTQRRVVNNLQGGRNVAYFNFIFETDLDQNDYVKLQLANQTGTTDLTAEISSNFLVSER